MATEIKQYFEANNEALEVLVAVGKKMVSVVGRPDKVPTPTHTQRVVTKDVAKILLYF